MARYIKFARPGDEVLCLVPDIADLSVWPDGQAFAVHDPCDRRDGFFLCCFDHEVEGPNDSHFDNQEVAEHTLAWYCLSCEYFEARDDLDPTA